MEKNNKEKALSDFFKNHRNILIAFSGGVDSALLAAAAVAAASAAGSGAACTAAADIAAANTPTANTLTANTLTANTPTANTPTADTPTASTPTANTASAGTKLLAVTVKTEFISDREIQAAQETANEIGITHIFIEKKMLDFPEIKNNQKSRCYVCKKELMGTLLKYAEENGFETVVEGTNYSDVLLNDAGEIPRPGFSAILELKEKRGEFLPKIESPLADLKITKEEIREMAGRKNLSAAGKPSGSCSATRFSYETEITADMLKTIDSAEQKIKEIGAKQIRIRCHTDSAGRNFARIEVEKSERDIFFDPKNQEAVDELIAFLKENGFSYVTVDLEGFRSGSMDI
ncbi:ATP-dependent sacrificial sulfur transferase LarE [Methanimicrococcus sp. OttesenSCG-928-J09]|nr:ATP-dependent sacrificial sulfur transferase LarE [Methanimicrococcus sp. OttesenSCG-928-J09]